MNLMTISEPGISTNIKARILIAFFVGGAAPELIISIKRTAGVGVRSDGIGLAQIFGASDLDLLRFAETALKLHEAC
jgi:hypothetical protein